MLEFINIIALLYMIVMATIVVMHGKAQYKSTIYIVGYVPFALAVASLWTLL